MRIRMPCSACVQREASSLTMAGRVSFSPRRACLLATLLIALIFAHAAAQSPSPSPSQTGSSSASSSETASQTASQTRTQAFSASQSITCSESPSGTQSSTRSQSVTGSESPTATGSPTTSPSQSQTGSQTRSPIPGFCSYVTNGTCVIASSIVARNCSGSGTLFNITGDVAVNDLDVCALVYHGDVQVLPNTTLTCQAPEVCHLVFNVTGAVILESNALIRANTISMTATSLIVETGAAISTDGLGFLYGPGAGNSAAFSGGSHGGGGGVLPCTSDSTDLCCNGLYFLAVNASVGSWSDPLWTGSIAAGMGSGGGVEGAGRGGGRVILNLERLTVEGSVSSDGGIPASVSAPAGGAGSGGSVVVSATSIDGRGAIRANGGAAQAPTSSTSWSAGGGGRVSLAFFTCSFISSGTVTARGGVFLAANSPSAPCMSGAAGTVVFHHYTGDSSVPLYRELIVDNLSSQSFAVTRLDVFSPGNASSGSILQGSSGPNPDASAELDTLTVQNYAAVLTEGLVLREAFVRAAIQDVMSDTAGARLTGEMLSPPFIGIQGISMRDARVAPRAPTSRNITLDAAEINFYSSRLISDVTAVLISCDNFTFATGSELVFDGVVSIRADTDILFGGVTSAWSTDSLTTAEIQMWGRHRVDLQSNCRLVVPILGVYSAGNLTFSGLTDNEFPGAVIDEICSETVYQRRSCADVDWSGETVLPAANNYSLVLSSRTSSGYLLIDNNGYVNTHFGLLCGLGVEILTNTLSVSQRGCLSNSGWGAGAVGVGSDGGGGGHGGAGGASQSGGAGGLVYDSPAYPLYPGSGGGSIYPESSPAGGYLAIEGPLFISTDTSEVRADGGNTVPGTAGGGSGGTIVLQTGNLIGNGLFSATGAAGSSGGGGGGGGIIALQASSPSADASRARLELEKALDLSGFAIAIRYDPPQIPHLSSFNPRPWLEVMLCPDSSPAGYCTEASLMERVTVAGRIARDIRARLILIREDPPWTGNTSLHYAAMALLNLAARKTDVAVRVLDECMQAVSQLSQSAASGRLVMLAPCLSSDVRMTSSAVDVANSRRWSVHQATGVVMAALWATVLPLGQQKLDGRFLQAAGGEIAQNFNGAFDVSGGPGANDGGTGAIAAPLCPAGFGGKPRCAPCGMGAWRNGSVDAPSNCAPCNNKPSMGVYTYAQETSENCEYVCSPGYLYPYCRTPFDEVSLVFGGLVGFVLFVLAILFMLFLVLVVLYRRAVIASEALKLSAMGEGARGGSRFCCSGRSEGAADYRTSLLSGGTAYGAIPSLPSSRGTAVPGSGAGMATALALLRRSKRGGCQCWTYGQDKSAVDFLLSATSLQEIDVPRHVHRIYFAGANTFGSSWRLPTTLPAAAMRHVHRRQYRDLCAALNADLRWHDWSWERALYLLCWGLCPPAGSYLHRWQRRRRCWRVLTRILAGDESHRWLRGGVRAEALQDNIRVGISSDFSLAYVDLLRTDDSAHRPRRSGSRQSKAAIASLVSAPPAINVSLPLALFFSGEGSFECPFFLDPNDMLLRAVPGVTGLSRFIHLDWVDFVAELNIRARCIVSGAVIQTIGPLIAFVEAVNAAGQDGALGGLRIDIVRFWPESRTMASKRFRRAVQGASRAPSSKRTVPLDAPAIGPAGSGQAAKHEPSSPGKPPTRFLSGSAVSLTRAARHVQAEKRTPSKGSASSGSGSDTSSSSSSREPSLRDTSPSPRSPVRAAGTPAFATSPTFAADDAPAPGRVRATSASAAMLAALERDSGKAGGDENVIRRDALRAAPSLDGFQRGRRIGPGAAYSDDEEEGAPPVADDPTAVEDVCSVMEDDDEADDAPKSGGVTPLFGGNVASFSALEADTIDLEGLRLGLLISLIAPAVASVPAATSRTAVVRASANAPPRPALAMAGSIAARPVDCDKMRAPRLRHDAGDDFQFGLGDDGVAVFSSSVRRAGGIRAVGAETSAQTGRGSQVSRRAAAFDLDYDHAGLEAQSRQSHLSALVDGDSRQRLGVAPVSSRGYTALGASLSVRAPPARTQRQVTQQRGHDWQQGPVVVSRLAPRVVRAQKSSYRRLDDDDQHSRSWADDDDEDDDPGSRCHCCSPCVWVFRGVWAFLSALFHAVDPARSLDIGGHDDVLGQRIDLRLPYAGLPVCPARQRTAEELATLTSFLQAPRQGLCCRLLCRRSGRGGRRPSDRKADASTNAPPASARGMAGPQTVSGLHSDDALPPVVEQALVVATGWAAARRRRRRNDLTGWDLEAEASAGTQGDLLYEDGDESGSSGGGSSGGSSWDGGGGGIDAGAAGWGSARVPARRQKRDAAANGGFQVLAVGSGEALAPHQRHRGESFNSGSTSDSARRHKRQAAALSAASSSSRQRPYARPAPRALLWAGGVTCGQLCCLWRGGALSFRRLLFVIARVFKRMSLPEPQPPAARVNGWATAAAAHVLLMLVEVAMTVVLISELWCIEPFADIAGGGGGGSTPWATAASPPPQGIDASSRGSAAAGSASGAIIVTQFSDQECNMGPLVLWAAFPPGAFVLPALLGLGAVAVQSSRALRLYALWNAVSLWSGGVAAALVLAYVRVLGWRTILFPLVLMGLKTAAAQCVGVQLYEIESARPIRGWRGLFEVRTGPAERTSNADVRSEYRG